MQPRTPWWQWLTAAGVLLWIGSGAAVAQVPVVGAQSAVGWDEGSGSTAAAEQPPTIADSAAVSAAWQAYDASFVRVLPPTIRVGLLLALCIACFGIDLHVLEAWGINVWSHAAVVLPVHRGPNDASVTRPMRESGALTLYVLSACVTGWSLICLGFYHASAGASNTRTLAAQAWEIAALVGPVTLCVLPSPFRATLRTWNRTLGRIFTPSLHQIVQFSDVVAADILTSFARVLGDVWLSLVICAHLLLRKTVEDRVLWAQQSSIAIPLLTRFVCSCA
jgi:hypothetical protein